LTLKDIRYEMEALQREVMNWNNDVNKAWLLEVSIRILGLVKVEEKRRNDK